MKNLLTYIETYQGTGWEEKPFNMIDSLILSQLSYYDYSRSPFVMDEFRVSISTFFRSASEKILCHAITLDGDTCLFQVLKQGGRIGSLRACRHVDVLDEKKEKQFSAIAFELRKDEYYIAFRGTDNTVLGWKEDFAMTYKDRIPAQAAALQYVMDFLGYFSGKIYIGGHSKGGNLAIYAAANLPRPYQARVIEVHNFDGPGFLPGFYQTEGYQRIRPRVKKVLPQSSIFGLLLEKDSYRVIHSVEKGMMQHDPYSWTIEGADFTDDQVDEFGLRTNRILERWFGEYTREELKDLVEIGYDIITGTGIAELYDLADETLSKVKIMLEEISELNSNERKTLFSAFRELLEIYAEEKSIARKEQRQERREKIRKLWMDALEKRKAELREERKE